MGFIFCSQEFQLLITVYLFRIYYKIKILDKFQIRIYHMTKVNKKEIKDFINTWQNQGKEVADKVTIWNTLLELLGVPKEQIDN